jgi:hypothetical protein
MKRITGAYVDPTANGVGKPGFTNGVPGVTGATVVQYDWLNAVQEEIALSIEGAGITLNPASNTQLLAAIRALSGTAIINAAQVLGSDHSNFDFGETASWPSGGVVRFTVEDTDARILGLSTTSMSINAKLLINTDATSYITLVHNDATQSAGNKLFSPSGVDFVLHPGCAVLVFRDVTSLYWRIVADRHNVAFSGTLVSKGAATFEAGVQIGTGSGAIITDTGAMVSAGAASFAGGYQVPNASSSSAIQFSGTKPTYVTLIDLNGGSGTGWTTDATDPAYLVNVSPTVANIYTKRVFLPHGAITNYFATLLSQDTDTAADLKVELIRKSVSGGTWGAVTVIATCSPTSFGASQYKTTAVTHTVDNVNGMYFVRITASDAAGITNAVYYSAIALQDPGPTNQR